MRFSIGDIVRVRPYDKLPENVKSRGLARLAGKDGVIVDVMYSNAKGCDVYKLHLDGYDRPSNAEFPEGSFDLLTELETPTYTYEFEFLENLVVARLYEVTETTKTEVAKGHGHIFHEGVLGIAQAASYAMKKLYMKIEGGENG